MKSHPTRNVSFSKKNTEKWRKPVNVERQTSRTLRKRTGKGAATAAVLFFLRARVLTKRRLKIRRAGLVPETNATTVLLRPCKLAARNIWRNKFAGTWSENKQ